MIVIRCILSLMLFGVCKLDCTHMKYRQFTDVRIPTTSSAFTTTTLAACCDACSTKESCMTVRYDTKSHLCEEGSSQLIISPFAIPASQLVYATGTSSSMYELVKKVMTRNDAESHCQSNGGHLIQIDSESEQSLLMTFLQTYGHNADQSLDIGPWIGLTDQASEGVFTWADGSPVGYTNWSDEQPDNAGLTEHCVYTRHGQYGGEWNDLNCDYQLWSVCEYN